MRNTLLALCLLQALRLTAGGDPLPMGARAAGMGYTGLATADLWSLRLNPAGIAGLEKASAGLFYQQHFLSGDLAQQGLAFALPVGKGAFGIAGDRFGYDLYNETRIGLAYAMQFNEGFRAGIQLNHVGVRLGDNYGSTGTFTAELGMQARLTNELWIGAHLYNPTQALLGTSGDGAVVVEERVPTLLRAGLVYIFSKKLSMTAEAEKDIDRPERFRFGVEYNPNNILFLRTGVSTGDLQGHFGAGFRLKQLDIDLAVVAGSRLGATPVVGINYRFK